MPPPYRTDRRALERDSEVEFYTGPGPGGQHRNKTRSAVRIYHRPSGVRVTATERRSQPENLEVAFARLARRLEQLNARPAPRLPTKVPRRERKRRTEEKVRTGRKKRERGAVRPED